MHPVLIPLALATLGFILTAAWNRSGDDEASNAIAALVTIGLIAWWSVQVSVAPYAIWGVWILAALAGLALWRRIERPSFQRPNLVALVIVVLLFGVAITRPPGNWDSMTYHLPRVMHWIQDGGLALYPTHILRQLHSGPWAEVAVLHTMVLTGGDGAANLVQWAAFAVSIALVARIALLLGGDMRAVSLATAMAATLPIAMLQATSTQNDVVVAMWILAAIAACLTALNARRPARSLCIAAAALGLAILTKPTALLFAFPFAVWFAVRLRRVGLILIAVLVVAVTIAPHVVRNLSLHGNPLGAFSEGGSESYVNERFTPAAIFSNVVRNASLHLALPSAAWNDAIVGGVESLHHALGLASNDPGTTWGGMSFRLSPRPHQDTAGNPLHFVLACFALALSARASTDQRVYLACSLAGALLFCIVLKWQPWHGRLHLPVFLIAAPVIAIIVTKAVARRWLAAALVVGTLPVLLADLGHHGMFVERPGLEAPYRRAVQAATDRCSTIGLVLGPDDWEYPFWALARRGTRFHHIGVTNASAQFATPVSPCAVLVTWPDRPATVRYGSLMFTKVLDDRPVAVYRNRAQ